MVVYKINQISRALLSKGFRVTQADHTFYWFYWNGKKTYVRTKISHGKIEYDDRLLGYMSLQLHLEKKELEHLIECSLTEKEYTELLIKKKVIIP